VPALHGISSCKARHNLTCGEYLDLKFIYRSLVLRLLQKSLMLRRVYQAIWESLKLVAIEALVLIVQWPVSREQPLQRRCPSS
jgi:hypothetical protein